MIKSFVLIFTICAAVVQAKAQAQEDSVKSKTLESVIVTSTRAGQGSGVTQTTVDSATLKQHVVGQDVQFVLERTVPSIVSFSESGTNFSNYGTFRLRGIDQTRVNVTFNGAPLNDMIDQGVFFSNITDLANSVSSIQVQRGVGMSQFGTASFAGAVNMQSPTLTAPARGRVQVGGGSFGLARGSAEASTGLMPSNTSVFAKATAFRTDGYRYNSGSTSFSGLVSAGWFSEDHVLKFTAIGGNTKNQLAYFPVSQSVAVQDPRTNVNDSTDNDDFGQYLLQLEWSSALSSLTTTSLMAYYGSASGDFYSGFRDEQGTLTQINYPLSNKHLGAIAQIDVADLTPGLHLNASLHAYRFWRRNWEFVSPESTRPYYDDRTVKNELSGTVAATYTQAGVRLDASVQLRTVSMDFRPDANFDFDDDTDADAIPTHSWLFVNPRLAASITLTDQHSVYTSVGVTGREPTRFDLLGGTQINSANINVLLNPNTVRAEHVVNVEIGHRVSASWLSLETNAFVMLFTDEIAPIGQNIEQQFVQLRKNMPQSQRYGIEFNGTAKPLTPLSLNATVTWMRANISTYAPDDADVVYTNVTPVLTPEWLCNLSADVQALPSLTIGAVGRYIGSSFVSLPNSPELTLDAALLFDSRLQWKFAGESSLIVTVYNLFDTFYATNGVAQAGTGGQEVALFVQPPRSFVAMVEFVL